MKTLDSSASLSVGSPNKIRRIRNVLREAGYTGRGLQQLLDVDELPSYRQRWEMISLYARHTQGLEPLKFFVRLFFLQQAVDLDDARQLVSPIQLEDWVEVGLLHVEGREVTATGELCPYGSFVIAADWAQDVQPDMQQVMGIAASSRTLAQATIRCHSKATLDLGTGSGILSLLAAAHSDRVVAIDSNPRALRMARFNAQLNGAAEIEFLEGNLFEPVAGRQFDLIVCNPPFIVAPEQIYLHSHSHLPLDRLCETIIRTAPAFMREDGYCQVLCNWVQLAGGDWRRRLASWFDSSGCDAWVLYSHSEDAAEYAFNRIANLTSNLEQRNKHLNIWMGYYERERVEAIGFGLITMRRSNRNTNWFKCEAWPEMIGPCGDAIERGFAARDFLQSYSGDQELLQAHVRRAPHIEWCQAHDIADLDAAVQSSLRFTSGLAYSANMDSSIVKFVSRCTGDRPLSHHLREAAAVSGEDPTSFAPRFLKIVRRLIEIGALLPVQPVTRSVQA